LLKTFINQQNIDKLHILSTNLPVSDTISSYKIRKQLDFGVGLRSPSVLKLALMSLAKKLPYVHVHDCFAAGDGSLRQALRVRVDVSKIFSGMIRGIFT